MLVVGVTELCNRGCYYCPNPKERSDVSYAGDLMVDSVDEIYREAELIEAASACITGGEPLFRLKRTLGYIESLKSRFGSSFHIHLYTCMNDVAVDTLKDLYSAGLDEIRFHLHTSDETSGLERALKIPWRVGVEIPCIPSPPGTVPQIVEKTRELGVSFVNLNEFQMAPSNYRILMDRGFRTREPIPELERIDTDDAESLKNRLTDIRYLSHMQVTGSFELAMEILSDSENWSENDTSIHFCSSNSKFFIQKVNRDKRRAASVSYPCDEITETGRLLFGQLICRDGEEAESVTEYLCNSAGVRPDTIHRADRIVEIPWYHAARNKRTLVEMWPTISLHIREVSSYERQNESFDR